MFSDIRLKGVTPFLAIIVVVAIVIGVGITVSLFLGGLIQIQAESASTGGIAISGCGGAFLTIEKVNQTEAWILVSNPTRHTVYTLSVFDDTGTTNSTIATTEKRLTAGSVALLNFSNKNSSDSAHTFPSGSATKVTVSGFCEFGSTNFSIEGSCENTGPCWAS